MDVVERILVEHPFFKDLDERYLQMIAQIASKAQWDAGSFIFREGDQADRFFLIRQGTVSIEVHTPSRGPIMIETLGAGDILGWSWSVPPFKKRFDARAIELTRAIVLDGVRLRAMCEEHKDLGYELLKRIMQVMAQRLQATRLRLIDIFSIQ